MKEVLDSKIAFLAALFSAGGAALTRIFVTDNIGWNVTAIAWILSLLISLFVSVAFQSKAKLKIKLIISSVLLVFALVSFGIYMNKATSLVCEFQTFNDTTATQQIILGSPADYTEDADTFVKYHPRLRDDPCALLDSFGRVNTDVWTLKGLGSSKKELMLTYSIFVVFFVACITYMCEYLSRKSRVKRKSTTNK